MLAIEAMEPTICRTAFTWSMRARIEPKKTSQSSRWTRKERSKMHLPESDRTEAMGCLHLSPPNRRSQFTQRAPCKRPCARERAAGENDFSRRWPKSTEAGVVIFEEVVSIPTFHLWMLRFQRKKYMTMPPNECWSVCNSDCHLGAHYKIEPRIHCDGLSTRSCQLVSRGRNLPRTVSGHCTPSNLNVS
jgi:hypothetical protein